MNRLNGTRPLARYEIKTGETLSYGMITALQDSDGKAVPASDVAGISVIGITERSQNGSVEILDGVVALQNDTVNAVTREMRGLPCYVKDSLTVDSNGGTHKVVAGLVIEVYDGEVFVDSTPAALRAARALTEVTVPTKATGAEVTTGTDDAKFVTPKALADAGIAAVTNATAAVAGKVKQGVAVANAAETAPTKAEFDALLASLRTAGVIAAE